MKDSKVANEKILELIANIQKDLNLNIDQLKEDQGELIERMTANHESEVSKIYKDRESERTISTDTSDEIKALHNKIDNLSEKFASTSPVPIPTPVSEDKFITILDTLREDRKAELKDQRDFMVEIVEKLPKSPNSENKFIEILNTIREDHERESEKQREFMLEIVDKIPQSRPASPTSDVKSPDNTLQEFLSILQEQFSQNFQTQSILLKEILNIVDNVIDKKIKSDSNMSAVQILSKEDIAQTVKEVLEAQLQNVNIEDLKTEILDLKSQLKNIQDPRNKENMEIVKSILEVVAKTDKAVNCGDVKCGDCFPPDSSS